LLDTCDPLHAPRGDADVLNQLAGTPGAPRALHAAIFHAGASAQKRLRGAARTFTKALPPAPPRRLPARHRPVLPLLQQLLSAPLRESEKADTVG